MEKHINILRTLLRIIIAENKIEVCIRLVYE
jgi:hypothetical protein